jgi:hypothetical protein
VGCGMLMRMRTGDRSKGGVYLPCCPEDKSNWYSKVYFMH